MLGPITAFRLVLLDVPDAEVYPWLPESAEPWPWIWTSGVAALTSWIRRKTEHFGPLARDARRAGLLPGPETRWLHAHNLPELLARIAGARHHRGPAKALRAVEQLTPSEGRS